MLRLVPEMIPCVTESVNVPSGLPMAIASWPTCTVLESPSVTAVRPVAFTLMRARSCAASVVTTVADSWRVSSSVTVRVVAPETTWLLVRIRPLALTMNPDPTPVEGTENGDTFEVPSDVMVTTEGLTAFATRMIASVWVRLISCALPVWAVDAVTTAAGFAASDTATQVPPAESEADSRATATTRGARRRAALCCLGGPETGAGGGGGGAHGW